MVYMVATSPNVTRHARGVRLVSREFKSGREVSTNDGLREARRVGLRYRNVHYY